MSRSKNRGGLGGGGRTHRNFMFRMFPEQQKVGKKLKIMKNFFFAKIFENFFLHFWVDLVELAGLESLVGAKFVDFAEI